MGRVSKKVEYWLTDKGLTLLSGWALEGLTDAEIARDKIKIHPSTFRVWQQKYPEISEAMKTDKEIADDEVMISLHDRCIGYTKTVKEPIKLKKKKRTKDGETIECEEIAYADREIYVPPDTNAMIFWMRCRKHWTDRIVDDAAEKGKEVLIVELTRKNSNAENTEDNIG